jgi:hypothetical protein
MNHNKLQHTGVKGMRWGHRKQPEYIERSSLNKLTVTGKKLQEQNLRVLKEGDTVHHVTIDPNLKPRAGGLYVSYTEKDAETYRTEYKDFLEVTRNAKKVLEYDLKTTEDIITPSKKQKIDSFMDLYKSKTAKDLIETMSKDKVQSSWLLGIAKYLGHDKTKDVTKKYREMMDSNDPKKQQKAFDDFAQFLVWEPKIRKQYFEKLAKEGFNAMYDDFDQGTGMSKEPLIVFDPSKTLKIEKVRNL